MSLLTTTLVFITIGCVYSQDMQFGQFGHDFDEQLSQMGKNIDRNLKFGQLSDDMDKQFGQLGKDINKNFQFDRTGQDIDKHVNQMGENVGKHMNTFGNQMGNQFEKLGDNVEKQFSSMQFGSGTNQGSLQSSPFDNAMKEYVDKMLNKAKEKCASAGHGEVSVQLENTFATAYQCVKEKVNVGNLNNDFSAAIRTNDLRSFYKSICTLWPSTYHCIRPVIVTYEKCVSSIEVKNIEKSLELIDASNDFFCENDADRITKFIEQGGFECYANNQKHVQNCISTSIQDVQNEGNNGMVTYDEQECNILNNFRRCVVERFRTCPSTTPSEIIDDYFGFVITKACNSASSITWFSFVNIILLTFTYLYSKMF